MSRPRLKEERTLENIKEFLSYDPDTGDFTWLVTVNTRARCGAVAGCEGVFSGRRYRCIGWGGEFYLAHRLAYWWVTGEMPPNDLDHKDGNGLNNAWDNLRAATRRQNSANNSGWSRRVGRYKGVQKHKRANGFTARIGRDYIGSFRTEEDAARAYDAVALQRFGEFARLNFPNEEHL